MFAGDISGQIEPLLSSFDEPTPLTAIPANAMQLKRLDEEECSSIQIDDDDDNDGRTGGGDDDDDDDDDDDAKIPLLTSPEVISRVACHSIHRLRISYFYLFFFVRCRGAPPRYARISPSTPIPAMYCALCRLQIWP